MSVKKKPLVVVTRKLPDSIETRMRELFDARLNLDDTPMTPEQIADAVRTADVLVPTVTDEITEEMLKQPDCKLQLIANFGNGVDNIDVDGGACARHHRDQHAEGSDRRHRRHDHGADPRGAAAADRGRLDPDRRQGLAGLVADLDARPSHRRQAARHHRHGPHRPGRGAPRARLRPADPLSQPPPRRAAIAEELGATYWESLDQMLARMDIISVNCPHTPATFHLLSARRLKLIRKDAYIVNTARGEVIDEDTLIKLIEAGDIGGAGLDVFEHEPAVNPKLVRLAKAGKVTLLPHMGSATIEGRVEMGEKVIINIRTFLDNHKPPDRVLPSML